MHPFGDLEPFVQLFCKGLVQALRTAASRCLTYYQVMPESKSWASTNAVKSPWKISQQKCSICEQVFHILGFDCKQQEAATFWYSSQRNGSVKIIYLGKVRCALQVLRTLTSDPHFCSAIIPLRYLKINHVVCRSNPVGYAQYATAKWPQHAGKAWIVLGQFVF